MYVQSNFLFLDKVIGSVTSNAYLNSNAESATLQISGDFTSGSFVVEGKTDSESTAWETLAGINLSDFSVSGSSITEKGIYQFGVDGIRQIRVRSVSVSGGTATVVGRMARTV